MPDVSSSLATDDTSSAALTSDASSVESEGVTGAVSSESVTDGTSEVSFTSVNPNDLPPELQPHFKRLQADYTRKRQAESAQVRSYEQQLAQYQQAMQQLAPVWQDFTTWYASRQTTPTPTPAQTKTPDYASMTPEEILQAEVTKHLTPMQSQLAQYQQALHQMSQYLQLQNLQQSYTTQVAEAFSTFGEENVRQLSDEIIPLIQQNPTLTVSQAYQLLSFPQAKRQGAQEVQASLDAKRRAGSVTKPTSRSAPAPKFQPSGDPFADAVAMAKAELAGQS